MKSRVATQVSPLATRLRPPIHSLIAVCVWIRALLLAAGGKESDLTLALLLTSIGRVNKRLIWIYVYV